MEATPTSSDLRHLAARCAALIVLIAAAACTSSDNKPTQPALVTADEAIELANGDGGCHGFYPLSVGNEWLYSGQRTMYVEGDSFVAVELYREKRWLIGTEELFGRSYIVEQQGEWNPWFPEDPWSKASSWIRYRQDKAGLYEADVTTTHPPDFVPLRNETTEPPATRRSAWESLGEELAAAIRPADAAAYRRALARLERKINLIQAAVHRHVHRWPHRVGPPGGAFPDELTRLKYPLHPGQTWAIRDNPLLTSTVEAREVLNLPAGHFSGWRVKVESELFGAGDVVLLWYGRDGFLKLSVHAETEETDYENPYGTGRTMVFEEHMILQDLELVH